MRPFFITAFVMIFSSLPAIATPPFTAEQVKTLEQKIEETLLKNPEIIEKAFVKLQEKKEQEQKVKSKSAISKYHKDLFNNASDPVGGNPQGKISLVIFMDPFCGHCRRFHKVLEEAEKAGELQNARLIYKDFPILGRPSILAVFGALAAHKQGKYLEFQKAMFSADPDLTEDKIFATAETLGLDSEQFKKDFKNEANEKIIQGTFSLAQNIGVNGTPALVLQDTLIPGAVDRETLRKLLTEKTASTL